MSLATQLAKLAQAVTVDSSKNIGIGTSSPTNYGATYKTLDIKGSYQGSLVLGQGSTNNLIVYGAASETGVSALTAAPLVFGTNSTERMRITSGGNFLIGTTTDGGRLTVDAGASSQYGTFNAATSGNCGFVMKYAGTQFGAIGNGSFTTSGGSATDFGISAANNLLFDIGVNEKMRIDSSGNVNIGSSIAPNTASLANRFLQLTAYGYGSVGTYASNGILNFTCNISANTATTFLTVADSTRWSGTILISYVRDADQNRSGMKMVRYTYNQRFAVLLTDDQNSGSTFSVSGNNLQVTIGGAGTYLTQITIWGASG